MVDLASSSLKRDKRGRLAKNEGKAAAAMVDLANSPSKRVKRGRPTKNEGEAAMVDLASSPSKGAMVDFVSSPSKGVTFVRYTRGNTSPNECNDSTFRIGTGQNSKYRQK